MKNSNIRGSSHHTVHKVFFFFSVLFDAWNTPTYRCIGEKLYVLLVESENITRQTKDHTHKIRSRVWHILAMKHRNECRLDCDKEIRDCCFPILTNLKKIGAHNSIQDVFQPSRLYLSNILLSYIFKQINAIDNYYLRCLKSWILKKFYFNLKLKMRQFSILRLICDIYIYYGYIYITKKIFTLPTWKQNVEKCDWWMTGWATYENLWRKISHGYLKAASRSLCLATADAISRRKMRR